jgi:hypothetical protein
MFAKAQIVFTEMVLVIHLKLLDGDQCDRVDSVPF